MRARVFFSVFCVFAYVEFFCCLLHTFSLIFTKFIRICPFVSCFFFVCIPFLSPGPISNVLTIR